ncbi:MAG TPA: hypothetical protein VF777_07985 [Phycisphaerales bacterium]
MEWLRSELAIAGGTERDRWSHRRGEPRTFAFLWSMFLMFAALVALGVVLTGGIVSLDAYQPLSRGLVVTITVGVLVFWPLIRLSQDVPEEGSILATLKDLAIVLIPVQAVVWPQMFLARWSLDTLMAMSLALTAWTLVIGAILVLALRVPNTKRSLWMLLCLVLALGGLVGGIAAGVSAIDPLRPREPNAAPAIVLASGVGLISDISADRAWSGSWALTMPQHWTAIKWTFVVAALVWVPGLWLGGRGSRRGGGRDAGRGWEGEPRLDSEEAAGDQGNPGTSDAGRAPAAGLAVESREERGPGSGHEQG